MQDEYGVRCSEWGIKCVMFATKSGAWPWEWVVKTWLEKLGCRMAHPCAAEGENKSVAAERNTGASVAPTRQFYPHPPGSLRTEVPSSGLDFWTSAENT